MQNSREQRVAVITGSNRATGYAIAEALHADGWRLVSINRTLHGAEWLNEHRCDLADTREVMDVVRRISAEHDKIDAFIPTSASRGIAPIENLGVEELDNSIRVNFTSIVHSIRLLLPVLRRSRGQIVVIGSHAGSRFFEGGAAYSSTKAALKALVEILLLEERPNGVRSTLLSPGAIANFEWDNCQYKMRTDSVAQCVRTLLSSLPDDIAVGEVEIRPARLPNPEVSGLDRLQYL